MACQFGPRIKKIMQADEDVGKIAMAVPLLVSKALELFLQDLCDQTYAITLKRRAKTLNSLHLKQCVQTFNVFDFLREIVGKVPDLGGSDGAGDDHSIAKRRKVAYNEDNDKDQDFHRTRMHEIAQTSSSGRGRCRGRGRGRGRVSRAVEKESASLGWKFENHPDIMHDDYKDSLSIERQDNIDEPEDLKENIESDKSIAPVHDFDLNMDLDENGELKTVLPAALTSSSAKPIPEMKHSDKNAELDVAPPTSIAKPPVEMKHEELPDWSLVDFGKMDIEPIHLAIFNRPIDEDEEEEDYDEED